MPFWNPFRPRPTRPAEAATFAPPALSFERWFALQIYASDVLLLLIELLLVDPFSLSQAMFLRQCAQQGGDGLSIGAAAAAAAHAPHPTPPPPPAHPASHADRALLSFPCGDGQLTQLLFTLRAAFALDPRLRLSLCGLSSAGLVACQLATLATALAAPSVYLRLRNWLFVLLAAFGALSSSLWAQRSLGASAGGGHVSAARRRLAAALFGWRVVGVLRLPSALLLFLGPALWLLCASSLPALDGQAPTTPGPAADPLLWPTSLQTALLWLIIAVLPYPVTHAWERVWLWPSYWAHKRSRATAAAAATGTYGGGGGGGPGMSWLQGSGVQPGEARSGVAPAGENENETITSTAAAAAAVPRPRIRQLDLGVLSGLGLPGSVAPAAPPMGPGTRHLSTATEPLLPPPPQQQQIAPGRRVRLYAPSRGRVRFYEPGRGLGEAHAVSIKVPFAGEMTFADGAARVAAAAAAAVDAVNVAAGPPPTVGSEGLVTGARRMRLRLSSLVCVEGCVQLLMVVHAANSGGQQRQEQQQQRQEQLRDAPAAGRIRMHHVRMQAAALAAAAPVSAEAAAAAAALPPAGLDATMRALLAAIMRDSGAAGGARGNGLVVAVSKGENAPVEPPDGVFLWPPVLPRLDPAAAGVPATTASAREYGDEYDNAPDSADRHRLDQGARTLPPPEALQLSPEADDSAAAVAVLLPARALRGLTAVRCVVAGPVGRWQHQQQQVYLDAEVAVEELPLAVVESAEEPEQGGGGDGSPVGYRVVRLALPRNQDSPLCRSQVLCIHILPPQSAAAAFAAAAARTASPPAAAATDATPSDSNAADMPLATLPLLVLPTDAAQEVRQLYDSIGDDATVRYLEGLLSPPRSPPDAATPAARSSRSPRSRIKDARRVPADDEHVPPVVPVGPACLASFARAVEHHGYQGLAYDMGAVLQVRLDDSAQPEGIGGGGGEGLAAALQLGRDPRVVEALWGFLEERCMAACAGVLGLAADESRGPDAPASTGARTARSVDAAAASFKSGPCAAAAADAARAPEPLPPEDPPTASSSAAADPLISGASSSSSSGGTSGPTRALGTDTSTGGGGDVTAAAIGSRRWWLRSLLFGFSSPPGREAAYQDFKAAHCGHLDRAALAMALALRVSTTLRTHSALRSAAAAGAGARGGEGASCGNDALSSPSPAEPASRSLRLQLLAQGVYLVASLVPLLLAFLTAVRTSSRRRNRVLLLRGYLDAAALGLILLPWPRLGPLLPVPDAWMDACRRYGIHWMHHSVWEPATEQLSPHLEARVVLANLVPMFLLAGSCYGSRWGAALAFAAANALACLTISAVTDLRVRRRFLQQQHHHHHRKMCGSRGDD
ncbi:hypothetical protein PLESTM_001347900 [Pleodorina starrii]|nr:hypothetical protein PLESTM_001347900 [Pleodorina starrii]